MKLFFHFTSPGRATTYLLGPDEGGDAILVDREASTRNCSRSSNRTISPFPPCSLPHGHDNHTRAIGTIEKILPSHPLREINAPCSVSSFIRFRDMRRSIYLVPSTSKPRRYPAHSTDSLVYRIGTCSFTGDTSSGRIGTTPNAYARDLSSRRFPGAFFPSRGKRSSYGPRASFPHLRGEETLQPFHFGTYSPFPERTS
jgi:hypothetical protein